MFCGGEIDKVVSLAAYRERRDEIDPQRPREQSAPPASPEYQEVGPDLLLQLAHASGARGLSNWISPQGVPFEQMSSDWSADVQDGNPLAMRRLPLAAMRFDESYEVLAGFLTETQTILIRHASYMVGFQGSDRLTRAAYAEGRLSPHNFRSDITSSPYSADLIYRMVMLNEGFGSSSPEVSRDTLVMANGIMMNLSYLVREEFILTEEMPTLLAMGKEITESITGLTKAGWQELLGDDRKVTALMLYNALYIREASSALLSDAEDISYAAEIAIALYEMSKHVPAVQDAMMVADVEQTLMQYVGVESTELNSRAVSTLAGMNAVNVTTNAIAESGRAFFARQSMMNPFRVGTSMFMGK